MGIHAAAGLVRCEETVIPSEARNRSRPERGPSIRRVAIPRLRPFGPPLGMTLLSVGTPAIPRDARNDNISLTIMKLTPIARMTALLTATQLGLACSRFVWHEDPFTPDQAPTSETIVAGRDTTYVLKAPGYYLLAKQRSALWNREVLDDVAWRYHALFGDVPPMIAVRLDSATTAADTATMWRGVPYATVTVRRRPNADSGRKAPHPDREADANDSVRARILAGPMLAATAAETWLKARALDDARVPDSQPGGPTRPSTATATLPSWIEAGSLRILGSGGAPDRAAAELRADPKHVLPLASLFSIAWSTPPDALEIVRSGSARFGLDDEARQQDAAARARERRDVAPGASPLFIAQSVSILAFIHEKDPGLVARLADELTRGASIPDVLASSATLPHDVAGLDAAWHAWLKRSQRNGP